MHPLQLLVIFPHASGKQFQILAQVCQQDCVWVKACGPSFQQHEPGCMHSKKVILLENGSVPVPKMAFQKVIYRLHALIQVEVRRTNCMWSSIVRSKITVMIPSFDKSCFTLVYDFEYQLIISARIPMDLGIILYILRTPHAPRTRMSQPLRPATRFWGMVR